MPPGQSHPPAQTIECYEQLGLLNPPNTKSQYRNYGLEKEESALP